MSEHILRWYAVHTKPNSESKVAFHLGRQGFETYLPRYRKTRRHARKVQDVRAPLFPRYVFVAMNVETQRWLSINSTIGVARLVCNGAEPAAMHHDVVRELKGREDEDGLVRFDRRPLFLVGDSVRVIEGAFESCRGLVDGLMDRERISILLDLLGRKVRVLLDAESLVAA